jgi:hypothetical protein
MPGPGHARYAFPVLGKLYGTLQRIYELSVSLPDAPLIEFEAKTANLPKTTEVERLIVQRIGQDIFRERLMAYWQDRCPLTGITDPALLRASHIIPRADCDSDAERLNNGLLLSPCGTPPSTARSSPSTTTEARSSPQRSAKPPAPNSDGSRRSRSPTDTAFGWRATKSARNICMF